MFQGVERLSDESNRYIAVLYHGSFRVIIPMEEAVEPPRDYRGMEPESVLRYLVNKRLGAEVDYIVKGSIRNPVLWSPAVWKPCA